MQIFNTLIYFAITISVLVFVHEFGHFVAARICGMRVDRFSIGFPPRAFGKKIGHTDYCVSWLPIGGYVKIAGMVDESMDLDFLERPPEPWEFRAKPIWMRMFVLSAGVLMNLVLALVIFWGIHYAQGKTVRETTEVGYVIEQSVAEKGGLREGDKILQVNDRPVSSWDQIFDELYVAAMRGDVTLTVLRGGHETTLLFGARSIPDPGDAPFGIIPTQTVIMVGTVDPGKPADKLGLKPQDILRSINGAPIRYDQRVRELVRQNAGKPITIEWTRGTTEMHGITVPTDDGRIGISYSARYIGPVTHVNYSLLGALPAGARYMVNVTVVFAQQMWQIITGKVAFSQSVAGPIKIAQLATQSSELGLLTYLGFMALLSINLAILNILPFPALDGGHIAFLCYEAVFRKEVPIKVRLGFQKVGIAVLLAFMAFVVINDIVHF